MENSQPGKKWYQNWWGAVLMILIWPYYAVWAIWKKTTLTRHAKILFTGVFAFFAILYTDVYIKNGMRIFGPESKNDTANVSVQQNEVKEVSAEEKTKQEEARQARILAREEAEKRKRDEEEAKVRDEDNKRNEEAKNYCLKRKSDYSTFPILEESQIKTKENGRKSISPADANKKKGPQLTTADCRKIVDFMHKWGIEKIKETTDKNYWIGMSSVELTLSAGMPNDINTDNYGWGETEQWVYHRDSWGTSSYYFYIENDRLTSYQDY